MRTYIKNLTGWVGAPLIPTPQHIALALLPHLTTTGMLSQHETNILTDLCGSIQDVAAVMESEEGRAEVGRWIKGGSVRGLRGLCWGDGDGMDE